MKDTIAKIIKLLGDDEAETRCAAAMVLARLRPLDERAIKALRKGIKTAPLHARSYFLDALAATKDPRVIPDVIDMLESPGSVVDMAIGVARGFGGKALDEIAARHEEIAGWINGAYIKAAAGIHKTKAAKMLIDRLPSTDWEQARATSMFFNEHFDKYPEPGQRYIRKTLHRYLEQDLATLSVPAKITCLNTLRQLREEVDHEILLQLAEDPESPSIRRHALSVLEVLKPAPELIEAQRRRLCTLLDGLEEENLGRSIVDVLAAWDEPSPSFEFLAELAQQPTRTARDYAFQELASMYGERAAPILAAELKSRDHERRQAATLALAGLKSGIAILLDLFENSDHRSLRSYLADTLMASGAALDLSTRKRLRKSYVTSLKSEQDFDDPTLRLLGVRDRDGLNDYVARYGRRLIKSGDAQRAIDILQPVVRHRFGTAEVRFVLALANLKSARDLRRLDDPRRKRAIDILSPLARSSGYDLGPRLKRARDLSSLEYLVILTGLAERGPIEREVCRANLGRIDSADLDERDVELLARLRADLEART